MLVSKFHVKTKRGKKFEFMQTIGSILVGLRMEEGCVGIDFQQNEVDENQFYLHLDWQDAALFKAALLNKEYDIFEGAMKILCEPPIVQISDENMNIKIDMHKEQNTDLRNLINSQLSFATE
jgi:quinol monooxygenase YgiN